MESFFVCVPQSIKATVSTVNQSQTLPDFYFHVCNSSYHQPVNIMYLSLHEVHQQWRAEPVLNMA